MFFYILEIFIAFLFIKTIVYAPDVQSQAHMLYIIILHFYLLAFLIISVGHVIYDKVKL